MKVCVISSSPRRDSLTLRAALFIRDQITTRAGLSASLINLRDWEAGFLDKVWNTADEVPPDLLELWQTLHESAAYVIVTPEYNGMFSPMLSAVLDFFPKSAFHRKAFGMVTGSTGATGGMRAAMHLQQYILGLHGIPSPRMLLIGNVDTRISPEGNCREELLLKQAGYFLDDFIWLAGRLGTV